jgi:hypothetical protein
MSNLATLAPIDLTCRPAFDGREPDDWDAPLHVTGAGYALTFSLAEVQRHPFIALKTLLGEDAFEAIMQAQGYRHPQGQWETYVGADRLPLYYFTREGLQPETFYLVLVSTGEYQPGRVIAHVEGVWQVVGTSF